MEASRATSIRRNFVIHAIASPSAGERWGVSFSRVYRNMERHRIRNNPRLFELGERAHWRIWPHSRPLQDSRGSSLSHSCLQAPCASLIWGHPGSAMRLDFAGIRLACLIDYLKPGMTMGYRDRAPPSDRGFPARTFGRATSQRIFKRLRISWVPRSEEGPKSARQMVPRRSSESSESALRDLCCAFYRKSASAPKSHGLALTAVSTYASSRMRPTPREPPLVQCKAWNQQVGVKPVRELRGVMTHEKVEQALLMAPGFHQGCLRFRRRKPHRPALMASSFLRSPSDRPKTRTAACWSWQTKATGPP